MSRFIRTSKSALTVVQTAVDAERQRAHPQQCAGTAKETLAGHLEILERLFRRLLCHFFVFNCDCCFAER